MSNVRLRFLLAVAVLASAAALPVRGEAQVLYDNGVPDQVQGRAVSATYSVADNFTLAAPATVGSFQWYAVLPYSSGASTTTASYQWNIFSDAAGTPGSVLYSGAVAGQSATKTAYKAQGYDVYYFDTSIGSVPLGAGTYWLGIDGFSSPDGNGYWATSSQQGDAVQSGDNGQTHTRVDAEMAFSVSAAAVTTTPEPASVVLLATGLLGVFAVVRHRSAGRAW